MKRGKRAQFYLIAAIIIVVAIVSISLLTNYVQINKEPQRLYTMGDVLGMNGQRVIENAEYNRTNVTRNIENYLREFTNYLNLNPDIDFNLIILYGSNETGNITGKIYSRNSLGTIRMTLGDSSFAVSGGDTINITTTTVVPRSDGTVQLIIHEGGNNISIENITVLSDNNFLYMLTTNDGFNRYVDGNFKK